MAKRLTDTEIWDQDWFIELPSKYKLLWNFIKDKCDDCGIWRPNKSLLQKIIGEPVNLPEFLVFVNTTEKERISILPSGRWFLREYFIFQYGNKFKPKSPVHRGALKKLLSNGVHIRELLGIDSGKLQELDLQQLNEIGYEKGYDRLLIAYEKGSNRDKDKDKDKDTYTILCIRFKEMNIDSEDENFYVMVVLKMMDVYLSHKPTYRVNKEIDYHSLLNIAYWIASEKKWPKYSVTNEKEDFVVESWKNILKYIFEQKNDFYKKMTLDRLASVKNLRSICEEMKDYAKIRQEKLEKGRIEPEDYFTE